MRARRHVDLVDEAQQFHRADDDAQFLANFTAHRGLGGFEQVNLAAGKAPAARLGIGQPAQQQNSTTIAAPQPALGSLCLPGVRAGALSGDDAMVRDSAVPMA
jgi:hypothetical protein